MNLKSRPYGRLEDSTVDKSGRVKRVWLLVKWELLFKPFQPSWKQQPSDIHWTAEEDNITSGLVCLAAGFLQIRHPLIRSPTLHSSPDALIKPCCRLSTCQHCSGSHPKTALYPTKCYRNRQTLDEMGSPVNSVPAVAVADLAGW